MAAHDVSQQQTSSKLLAASTSYQFIGRHDYDIYNILVYDEINGCSTEF
jgi:hypothetical protein